jgi:hypothetical protein
MDLRLYEATARRLKGSRNVQVEEVDVVSHNDKRSTKLFNS